MAEDYEQKFKRINQTIRRLEFYGAYLFWCMDCYVIRVNCLGFSRQPIGSRVLVILTSNPELDVFLAEL